MLQLKQDMFNQRLSCTFRFVNTTLIFQYSNFSNSPYINIHSFSQKLIVYLRTLALLASYIVQSELGDYDAKIHKTGYLKEFKFVPNQPAVSTPELLKM